MTETIDTISFCHSFFTLLCLWNFLVLSGITINETRSWIVIRLHKMRKILLGRIPEYETNEIMVADARIVTYTVCRTQKAH